MGKFAGFLKRLKKVVNYGTKGIKWVKDKWNTFITRPGVGLLNTIIPGSQLLTDALFKLDDKVNQGLDWIIDKTNENQVLILNIIEMTLILCLDIDQFKLFHHNHHNQYNLLNHQ